MHDKKLSWTFKWRDRIQKKPKGAAFSKRLDASTSKVCYEQLQKQPKSLAPILPWTMNNVNNTKHFSVYFRMAKMNIFQIMES